MYTSGILSDPHSKLYPGDHILCFNLSIVPGITEFRKKNNAYSERTKLSAVKHPCRVTQPTRRRARPAFLCPRSDPRTDFLENAEDKNEEKHVMLQ